jgi:hypothetical protein
MRRAASIEELEARVPAEEELVDLLLDLDRHQRLELGRIDEPAGLQGLQQVGALAGSMLPCIFQRPLREAAAAQQGAQALLQHAVRVEVEGDAARAEVQDLPEAR